MKTKQRKSRAALMTELQEMIDEKVRFLAQLRSAPNLTRNQRAQIDELILEHQKISRSLPALVEKNGAFNTVFGPLKKTIDLIKEILV